MDRFAQRVTVDQAYAHEGVRDRPDLPDRLHADPAGELGSAASASSRHSEAEVQPSSNPLAETKPPVHVFGTIPK